MTKVIVRHVTLENGLDVYSMANQSDLFGVGVKTGYFHDPKEAPGLAHLTEHMLAFNGDLTEYKDLERRLRGIACGPGGEIDIHTGQEHTFYGTDVLLRKSHAHEAFEIFAKMVKNTSVRLEGLEVETAAVNIEHYIHGLDNPDGTVHDLLHELVYDKNPARKGFQDDPQKLRRLKPHQVTSFAKKHYVPNNMFAIFMGLSQKAAVELAKKHFGDMAPKEVPKIDYDGSESRPQMSGIKSVLVRKSGLNANYVAIGFPTEPFGHNSDEAIDVLSEILEFRLETALRRNNRTFGKGAYHPYVNISRSSLHGIMYVTFETVADSFIEEGIEKVILECEKIKRWGVDKAEVERALEGAAPDARAAIRRKIVLPYRNEFRLDVDMGISAQRTKFLDSFEYSAGMLTGMIINSTCNGDQRAEWVNNYCDLLKAVNPTKIVNVANQYLTTPDKFALVVLKPIPGTQEIEVEHGFYDLRNNQSKFDF